MAYTSPVWSNFPGQPSVPRKASVDLGKERDFQTFWLRFSSRSLFSPKSQRDPFPTNTSSCHTPTQNSSSGSHHTLYESKILTMTGKPRHNLAPGSLVYLISCPSLPLGWTAAHYPRLSSSNLPHTHPLQDLCFCCTLGQECFLSSSPGTSEASSFLHSNLCSSVISSTQLATQHIMNLCVCY